MKNQMLKLVVIEIFLMCIGAKCVLVKVTNHEIKTKTLKSTALKMFSNETDNVWLSQLNQMLDSILNLKLAEFLFFCA